MVARVLVFLTLLAGCSSRDLQAAQPQCWVLQQTGDVEGKQVAYLSSSGMKVESISYSMLVLPPKFSIMFYSNRSKCYFTSTYEELKARLFRKASSTASDTVRPGRTGKIAGLTARQYFLDTAKGKHIEFWTTRDILVPKQFVEYSATICEVPAAYGFPLRIIKTKGDGAKSKRLETLSCQRTVVPASTWSAPIGYKKVKDEMSVLVGDTSADAMFEQ